MLISAYEPQLVITPVNESPHASHPLDVYEPHGYEENDHEDFAQILAGFLQKTEDTNENIDLKVDVQIDAAALSGETVKTEENNIFGFARDAVIIPGEGSPEVDIPRSLAAEEQFNALSGGQLLSGLNTQEADVAINASREPGNEKLKQPADFITKTDSSSLVQNDENAEMAQASVLKAEEVLVSEEKNTKGAVSAKNVNFEKQTASAPQSAEISTSVSSRNEEAASLQKGFANEGRTRFDEARSRSRNRADRVSFEIRDMRTGAADTAGNPANNANMRINAGVQITGRVQDAPIKEITLELRLPDYSSANMGQSSAQTNWQPTALMDARASSAMENMLARELHQSFNGDIVRHASMALRDGGEGIIRIALKPESLGHVKIHLELSENKITGQIFVDSEEALNAFKKEIASLEQAFRESGFTSADLNLSMTADNRDADLQQQFSTIPQAIASRYDDAVTTVDIFVGQRPGSVNLLA